MGEDGCCHVTDWVITCGFFKRTKHEDTVPSYNAVRIKREVRDGKAGQRDHWENLEKKPWIRSWKGNQHHS
ncbi:unnamed protein product [Boreogadus saida]